MISAVLHGTWIPATHTQDDDLFFVWAERGRETAAATNRNGRVQRHPYAATAIEIAQLLSRYVPDRPWDRHQRLTRLALLPTQHGLPIVPIWLAPKPADTNDDASELKPWRVEGIGIPVSDVISVLVALPLRNHVIATTERLGSDLRYWGVVAKYVLELVARQKYLPGLTSEGDQIQASWVPVLDDEEDQERFALLTHAMPPACRAVLRDRQGIDASSAPTAEVVAESFLNACVDRLVRRWGHSAAEDIVAPQAPSRFRPRAVPVRQVWWKALWNDERLVKVRKTQESELTRLYKDWQRWSLQGSASTVSAFRICFRLEPPDTDGTNATKQRWTLRYFLQARDDPSLLVPAYEVWRERGDVLSYLSRRFDQPQEKLLEGLGTAARLCPAIRRSLGASSPEQAVLTDQEAFTFLRETSRLLEGAGFGVLVPPWWNTPDTRLRVRLRFGSGVAQEQSGGLGISQLIDYDWELALGDEMLSREEFERLAALKTPLVRVRGRWVLLQPDQVEAAIAFWQRHHDRGQLPLSDALGLVMGLDDRFDGLAVGDVELDSHLRDLVAALSGGERLSVLPAPGAFEGELRPYQRTGFSWLHFITQWGFGACLADDMGLGKTIQAIALMLHLQQRKRDDGEGNSPSLVICPTSLVGNWRREVERFAPELSVTVHHGTNRAEGQEFVTQSKNTDLVISSYGLMRRDLEDLLRVPWSHVILDEAQNIKNPMTKQARAARQLGGERRVALTGTPVENRLSELWSIMAFLNPGYLGSLESFRRSFAIPIERYQDADALERLRNLVQPFILRRLKTDPEVIQDLPEKFEYKVYCNLTREQGTLYEATVQDTMSQLKAEDSTGSGIRRRGLVLAMLTRLKQICNHPALFFGDGSDVGLRSGKLNRLTEMLEEVLSVGDRALVFTQFAQMGFLLQNHLQSTFGQEALFLHGGTPQQTRDRMLQRFQEDPNAPMIFVLSLKAGGTGLNLMRANHVFHYDRWWNPAVENQATDRAYRIGQHRDVLVHKYICLGTLEERIDELIESKRRLAENVVGTGESWLSDFTTDELRDLVTLRAEALEGE